jgi:type IV pilus assembly protein PilA
MCRICATRMKPPPSRPSRPSTPCRCSTTRKYGRYATSLTGLGLTASGAATAAAADLINSSLASGEKSGYKFTMTGNQGGYAVSAVPIVYGDTGSRSFYSDQDMVIRGKCGPEPATASSKELK